MPAASMSGMPSPVAAASVAALAGSAAWAAPALAPVIPAVSSALGVPRRLARDRGGIAVTFDDGPHPAGTPAVLAVLERAAAPATFFLVGEQVRRDPGL